MIKWVVLIAFGLFVASATMCHPQFLAENTFLMNFANHEVLSLMAVVLTVTLASVANIDLSLNRIVAQKYRNNAAMIDAARGIKKEMRDNCWLIFWGFFAVLVLLVAKGSLATNTMAISFIHGAVLWFLLLYLLSMYDVYQVVFGIAGMDELEDAPPDEKT